MLEILVGQTAFYALLDTGASVSLMNARALSAAKLSGATIREEKRTLRLAKGWSETAQAVRCRIKWEGGSRKQHFLFMPELCHDVVLGRDFLAVANISLHMGLGGWTLGIDPQPVVKFDKPPQARQIATESMPVVTSRGRSSEMDREDDLDLTEPFAVLFATQQEDTELQESHSAADGDVADEAQLQKLLHDFGHLFTAQPGCTTLMVHNIDTGSHSPVRCKLRPANGRKREILDQGVDELLSQDLIEPCTGPWASAPVLVGKKTGGYRVAVDYRALNARTKVPVHPMPRTDWVLAQLGQAKWFTSLDLSQGFFQVPIALEDRPKTAFICHKGMFQFKRMPFGVAGGPATFQALMDKVLEGIKHHYCMAFLDDVLVYSNTFAEHLEHISEVLRRIEAANLTINPAKVSLCKQSLKFLGHVISPGNCRPDPDKVQAVSDFPEPKTVKELQRFLGLVGYYRNFIPHFSDKARPLTTLLKKGTRWSWGHSQVQSFQELRETLASDVVVALPDLNRPFIIETDASGTGIAAVLLQEVNGQLRPVSFISRTLTTAERNYTVQEWECLAVVWAVDKFRPYIEFSSFEVHCDHASLAWMFSTEQTSCRVRRWVLRLQGLNCVIRHRRGRANIPADALSRVPTGSPDPTPPGIAEDWFPIETPEPPPTIILEEAALVSSTDTSVLSEPDKLVAEQQKDPLLQLLLVYLQTGCLPDDTKEAKRIRDLAQDSSVSPEGLLYYTAGLKRVVWLPQHLRALVLQMEHDHPLSAHPGLFKTLRRIRSRFMWLGLRSDTSRYVRACQQCQRFKPDRQKPKGLMDSTWATQPMQQLSVDLIGPLPSTPRQHKYILVVLDTFTKFVELFPLRAPTSKAIIDKMVEVFCRHGTPSAISSDNGKPFVSKLWKGVLKHWGIDERHTVPYRPAGQPVERHNATVKQSIVNYCASPRDWDKRLPEVAFAMRTTESVVTGFTPAFLCYGRELRTPWAERQQLSSEHTSPSASHALAAELEIYLQDALEMAKQHQDHARELQQRQYNRTRRPFAFRAGDLVLRTAHPLSNARTGFTAKLAPRRLGPFVVTARVGQNTYALKDPLTGKQKGLANADQLATYHPPWKPSCTD